MAENPFADLIPNGGSSGGDASPAPTPFTSYSIPAAVGGADESYDPYTAQGLGVNNIQLTSGVVAVNPSVNPLGTVFLNKDTGEAYIAADRHGNRNPNVVDIYKDPSDYRAESGQANLIPIDQIPLNQIPKSPAELKRFLSNYGKVPKSSAEDQQEQNPFSDLIPGSNQTIPTQANQSVATENPFSDLIPKQSSYGSQMIGGQGSIGPSAVTSSSMPWYSALVRSAAAQTAAGAIQTAGGFERAGAAPVTDISGVNAPFQRGATTQEAKSAFDKAIADRQASLDAIQGIVKKQGFSTAEYGNQINDLQREIGDLQAQKEQTLKLPQYASDTQQQELIQQRQQLGQQAGALSQQATGMFPALGVSQKDTSTAAQIGRGIGGVIDLAPGMLTGPLAFPTMATMAASQAYGEAYDTKVAELKQQGVTDPAQLDAAGHEAASKEAQKSAASILPYAVFGPIAGEATSALFKGASPLTQGLIGGAAATGVNLGVSGGLRAAQGQSFLPNVEQAVPDILFGAVHGLGAGLEARAEAKKSADAQLGGITPEVAPSSNPLVNEKEAQITANADQLHETPSPVINLPAATPEELAKSGETPITPETTAAKKEARPIKGIFDVAGIDQDEQELLAMRLQAILSKKGSVSISDIPLDITNKIGTGELYQIKSQLSEDPQHLIDRLNETPATTDNSQKILDLASQQFELDPNSKQYELIQQQIDELQKPAEAPVAESTHLPEKIEAPVETGPEAAATTQVQAKEEPPKEEKITPEPTPDQMAKHDLAYVDPESLKLSEDVPNFKEGADPITGVVAGEELKGKYDPEAAGIVHIWERLNGDREVISGRHRWQLALANKVPEILIKIHREADGFTKEDALVKDAQLNIKDEKGSVKDFAAYFRNDPITKEDAQQGGLLSRSKQKNGFSIGRYSEDDLYGLFRTGKISEAKAAAIAESAPNDPALQRAAIGASKGLSAEELPGYIALLKEKTGGNEEQTNLFGEDESFIKEAMRISKAASARANELSEQIRAVQGAARNPEAAAKLGVDVKDPQGLQKRISELKEQRDKYAKFWLHDDIKEELGIKKPALPTIETTGEGNLFGEKEMPFGLIGETESTPPETEPRREDTLTGSFDFGESSEQKKSNLEDWADNTIQESKKRLNTGLDPELLFAYAVKSAHFLGVRTNDFARWSKQMVKQFGEQIKPHLENIWGRVRQHASGEYNLIEDPLWKKYSGTPEEGEEAYTPSKIAWSDAARDMFGVRIHPSELPSFNDLHKISKWPEPLRDLATVNDVSYKLNKSTDVAGNEILDIATTPMEEEGGTFAERLGDFGGASFRNRLRRDIQKRNDAIERIKEKTKGLYTDEEILEKASELPHAGRIYAEDISARSKESRSRLEDWADNIIKESKKRLNVGLDPEVLSAYAIKGAFKIARGVKDFTAWSKEMLSEFGEAIQPHLEDLWSRANQLHNEKQATKYGTKPPSERETYAKGLAAHLTKVLGREPTQEELSKQVEKKFGKEETPAPAPVTGGEGEKISIRTKDQEDQQRRGILTSVVPAGEGTSIAGITEIGNANLRSGVDPFDALAKARQGDFNGLATAKAYVQGLAKKVSEALKKYGPNSPEYKDLAKQYQDYYEGLREAGTVASDILRTFQGETDLSDAADIAREYTKITGEEPSLSQHDQIRKVADKVNKTVEESNQAQQQHRDTMDAGLADVEVKTPVSVDESRQQVADLSDASGAKQKAEIDRLNQENEKIKRDLEEVKQAQGQTAEELKAYYEAKIKDLENQQAPQYGKEVLEQARKIVDRWKADAEEAGKSLRQKLQYQGAFPDVTIINDVARILRGYIGEFGLNLAESTARLVKEYGPEVEQYAKEGYAKAKELIAGEDGGEKAVKAVRIARTPKPKAKTVEKIGEEKVADNLRKRIAQYQKKIDDINSGKISTPKDVEKITNEEIKGLEADLANKKQELSNARLKAKQADLFQKGKVGEKLNPEQVKTLWETAKRFYLDKGESDYDKMINDMASDIGLLPDQIRQAFSSPKGAKKASDEMYLKQRNRQMALDDAKRWLDNQKASWIGKTFGALAEKTFKLAIFGHGTAFIGTHAPTTIYTHPRAAFKAWLKGFSYSFTGKNGQIKNIVENKDLIYRPNWITARRAGLENDPREVRREGATKERGDSVMANALNAISGGRGFDALFHLRQDMFDQAWNKLSITQKTPEMAEMLANSINNATGFTKGGKRTAGILQSPITKVLFFAPKLIASRFKWLIQDPARMLGTFTKMVNPFTKVTPEERMSAIYEAKNKAKFLAYLGGTLLANQALLSVTGSNQSINFTNPKKNDWLAYKGFGYQFSTVGAFTRIARLVAQEYHAIFGDLNRFEKAEGGKEQAMKNALYGYFRSGFSPIVRDMVVGATGKDYVGNVVPWSKEQPDRGRRRLTWGEVIQEQFAPIPISEASTQREIIPAVAKAASAAFSGGRLETPADIADYEKSLKPKQRSSSSGGFGSSGFGSKGFGAGGF